MLARTTVPTVLVTAAARSDHTFELNGSQRIGGTMQLRVDSPTASTHYLLGSFAPGLLPLDLLGLPFSPAPSSSSCPRWWFHAGPIAQSWTEPLPIPMDSGLIGPQIWFQAAIFDGVFVYLNAQHATITAN